MWSIVCLNIINFYTDTKFPRRDLVAQIYKSNCHKKKNRFTITLYIRFFIILLYSIKSFLYKWTMNVKSHHAKKFIHNQLHVYSSVFIKMKITDEQNIISNSAEVTHPLTRHCFSELTTLWNSNTWPPSRVLNCILLIFLIYLFVPP